MYPNTIVEIYMCIHLVWGYNLVWGYCIANQNQCMTTKPCFGLLFKNHLSMVSVTCQNNLNNKQPLFFFKWKDLQRIVNYIWGYFFQMIPAIDPCGYLWANQGTKKTYFLLRPTVYFAQPIWFLLPLVCCFERFFSTNNMHETYFFFWNKKHICLKQKTWFSRK